MRTARAGLLLVTVLAAMFVGVPASADAPVFAEPVPVCGSEATAAPERPSGTSRVDVATYNFLHALGTSNESLDARIPLIVDAIVAAGADVVGAQEVEELGSRGFTTARVARGLAAATGHDWHWCFFAANPVLPGEPDSLPGGGGPGSVGIQPIASGPLGETVFRTGVGILSRHPILAAGAHRLGLRVPAEVSACPDLECQLTAQFESRAAIRALVATPRGPLHVVSTHLAHTLTPLSEFTRAVQVERMLEWVDTFSAFDRHPVVLTGDFNTREGSPVYAAVATRGFVDTFRAANLAAGGFTSSQDITAAAATVRSRIDYVFARGAVCTSRHGARTGALPEVTSSAVLGDAPSPVGAGFLWPSDHYGVVSALKPFPATPGTCHAPGLRR